MCISFDLGFGEKLIVEKKILAQMFVFSRLIEEPNYLSAYHPINNEIEGNNQCFFNQNSNLYAEERWEEILEQYTCKSLLIQI